MRDRLEQDPWLRTVVSIGVVLVYLLLVHILAGVVYRAMVPDFGITDRVISAGAWAVAACVIVSAYGWAVTWRTQSGRPVLFWWVAPVVGVVALAELVAIVLGLFSGGGLVSQVASADAEGILGALERLGSPRVWAVYLWVPITVWMSLMASIRLKHPRPRRMILTATIPHILAGIVFITILLLNVI